MIAHAEETRRQWPLALRIVLGVVMATLIAAGIAWLFVALVPDGQRNIALRTMAVGIVANVCCALVGTWLVLRRMSLLGDAISHAVLPGLVLAVILSGRVEGERIEILEGLSDGDEVVFEGHFALQDGSSVIVDGDPRQAAAADPSTSEADAPPSAVE